jgi:hypothetical protein
MSGVRDEAADVLDLIGDMASALGKRGGTFGFGAMAAAAVLKTTAVTIRNTGESVDEIIGRIRAPRKLNMPWTARPAVPPPPLPNSAIEDTQRETPSSKAPKP